MRKKRATTKKAAPRKRKSVKRRSKGMLSELFNPTMAQAAGKTVLSGAVGGFGAATLTKLMPDSFTPKTKAFYTIGAGFITATLLKMPNVAAGMAGVGFYNLLQQGGMLAEDYNYANDLEALPMVLDESGASYLQESYLQEDYLQEDYSYDVGYYGTGFGLDNIN